MSRRSSRVMWSAVIIGPFTPRKLTYCQEKRTLTHAGIKAFSLSCPRYPLVSETWYSSAHAFFRFCQGRVLLLRPAWLGKEGGGFTCGETPSSAIRQQPQHLAQGTEETRATSWPRGTSWRQNPFEVAQIYVRHRLDAMSLMGGQTKGRSRTQNKGSPVILRS